MNANVSMLPNHNDFCKLISFSCFLIYIQRFCWILLLLITVSLLLWYSHITKNGEAVLGLRGYVRISPRFRSSSQVGFLIYCYFCLWIFYFCVSSGNQSPPIFKVIMPIKITTTLLLQICGVYGWKVLSAPKSR